jgi:ABC-type transport system substrate-binding protein
MQAAIGTLNPLLYTMAEEMMVIWPCYSNLLTHDVDGNLVGDLASTYSVSADGKTWHFNLVRTAKFYDMLNPTADLPLTGRDVRFTLGLVQNETGASLNSYIPKVGGAPLIDSMYYGVDLYDFYIHTTVPYGPLASALSSIPILPEYLWKTQAWNWDNFDLSPAIAPCIGSGPFYYGLTGMPSTGVVDLVRSPSWYGTVEYGWQLHLNKVTFKTEASQDSNLVDYQNGVIDIMMEVTPSQYLNPSLPGEKFAASTGFVYEYNLNQMTDARRATSSVWSRGTSNQLLLDPIVKTAIAMSVNEDQFVADVLNGLGSYADSLIPDVSPWHYWYGLQPGEDPERVGRAPVGEEPVPYNIDAARDLLNANGWVYDTGGLPNTEATPLCKAGGTSMLQFRYWTMDSDPQWNAGAQLLADAAWQIGVDIKTLYEVKNSAFMNSAWKSADYDMWLWDWMFSPTSEPSADIMEVLTTNSTWGDVFWSDPVYDALYDQSLVTADPAARQAILDEMQRMAYENLGCQLVAYRKELYAASTSDLTTGRTTATGTPSSH